MALETRTKKITGIVSLKGVEYSDIRPLLQNYLSSSCFDYAFILHDADFLEDGSAKTPHIHFCGNFKVVKRLSTILGEIANVLGLSPLAITISKYESYSACIQYLVHRNNPEKYQYEQSKIVTNLNSSELDAFMEDDVNFDTDTLIKVVVSSPDRISLIRSLGMARYKLYRNVINDIENDLKARKV